jgi:hypothetical protein
LARSATQKGRPGRRHEWSLAVIALILRAEEYTGTLTWHFAGGSDHTIEIPQIIEPEQWKRVQQRLDRNKMLATRNSKGLYMLQGLIYCGDCGRRMSVHASFYDYKLNGDGTRRRYKRAMPHHRYYCRAAVEYPEENHTRPFRWNGAVLDWEVWRYIVDNGIKQPDMIAMQVKNRQKELRAQGDRVDGDIANARRRLAEVDQERAFYQRQAGRGKIDEREFDSRMDESQQALHYWQLEIERLIQLRDDAAKVQSSLDYSRELLTLLQDALPEIDQTLDELKIMPQDERERVLKKRQDIIRALCDRVVIWSDRRVKLVGVLDGTESAQFDLAQFKVSLSQPYGCGG